MSINISLEELIKTGAHFGHQSKRWNPKSAEFLYGVKDGVHVFDLEKTKECLEEALNFLKNASKEGKVILFLGTKKQAKETIEKTAKETESFFVTERWLGGTFSNFAQIKKSTEKLTDMKQKMASGFYSDYTKKERVLLDREIQRLERFFGGLVGIKAVPEVLVVVDIKREYQAVREAILKGVKTIAITDSNTDPTLIDFPIPMNDDATKAIEYVISLMGEAIKEGRKGEESNTGKTSNTGISVETGKVSKTGKTSNAGKEGKTSKSGRKSKESKTGREGKKSAKTKEKKQ